MSSAELLPYFLEIFFLIPLIDFMNGLFFCLYLKEHCLMGIKGTVRRSTDGHIIHANIDTDVIIAEEPPYG